MLRLVLRQTERILSSGTIFGRQVAGSELLSSLGPSSTFPRRPLSTVEAPGGSLPTGDSDDDGIRMADYTYDLDVRSIATHPASPRGSSRLLFVDPDGAVTHYPHFADCFAEIAEGSHVVFNESRVVNARLSVVWSERGAGGRAVPLEMMILDMGEWETDVPCTEAVLKVMLRKVGVEEGDVFSEATSGSAKFEVVDSLGLWEEGEHSNGNGTECLVRCVGHDDDVITLGDLLERAGTVPIPPYLNREAEEADIEAYNNVYAAGAGSVAAPTAGLHFTDDLLRRLRPENVSYLSLHVGAGTFKPVVASDVRDHKMHAESFRVSVGEVRRIVAALVGGKPLIVVGTTSSRTLESLFWCGVKRARGLDGGNDRLVLGQDEWVHLNAEENGSVLDATEALGVLVNGKDEGDFLEGSTSLMIVPGRYSFRVVDHLVTNFHAPDSTLMLLVSAFLGSGGKVRSIYEDAQRRGYRFLSYGDVCMFSRPR